MEKQKIIIGLVGESGSGKDTAAEYIREKYGAHLMRFADPLKETLKIYFEKFSREDQQWLALEFRKRFGNDILSRAIRKRIEDAPAGIYLINGIRFWEDYDFIRSFDKNFILYTTADQKLRWERSRQRKEKTDDDVSFEKFCELERTATEVNIPGIGAKADQVIRNEKTLADFLYGIDEFMENIKKN